MPRDASYVAVYDVSDDRERSRVAAVLEGFGLRVQFSAFELRLTPATKRTFLRRLQDLKLATGFVYLYRRAGSQDRVAVGNVPEDTLAEANHAWVVVGRALGGCRSEPVRRKSRPNQSARRPKATPMARGSLLGNAVLPSEFALAEAHNRTSSDLGKSGIE